MTKKIILLLSICISTCAMHAQFFNNEWINFSQSYYKIKIPRNGLYKIDSTSLAQSGVPLNSINPRNIQLFQKGKELYIHIQGEADNQFNKNDYILFYAEKNSCKDDSALFYNSPYLANPYYSVINDTSVVFFTWNSSTNNRRLSVENDVNYSAFTPANYYLKEAVTAYNNEYYAGPIHPFSKTPDPRYVLGEGLASNVVAIDANNPATATLSTTFNTNGIYVSGPQAQLETVYAGASNEFYGNGSSSDYLDHKVKIEYKDNSGNWITVNTHDFDGYTTHKKNMSLTNSSIGTSTDVRISSVYNPTFYKGNRTYVFYIKLFYPQSFNLNNLSTETLLLPDQAGQNKSYLQISNFNSASNPVYLINISDHQLILTTSSGSNIQALVPNSGKNKLCVLSSTSAIHTISKLSKVNGTGSFTDYKNMSTDSAYVMVYHPSLQSGTVLYEQYRKSLAGGKHHTLSANIYDLYDQFAWGVEGHPYAIRNFINYLFKHFPSPPQNLFLIGKNIHAPNCISNPSAFNRRLIPSFGVPSSDILLTQGIVNAASLAPAVATGRLAAQSNTDISNYLDKVKLYEALGTEGWRKNILHFVGGTNAADQNLFNLYMTELKDIVEDTTFGGVVNTFKKTSSAPIGINTNDSIKRAIESGVNLITFFGHGSTVGFEQNIDDPFAYNNSPRFPMLLANSCYTGDIHTPNVFSNSEKFVLAKNHGTIGFIATVSTGVTFSLAAYSREFYKNISYRTYGKSYGEAVKQGVHYTQLSAPADSITHITSLEMTLHGDPACKPYAPRNPDYTIANTDVSFDIKSIPDSIIIKINLHNIGKAINDSFIVYMERILPNNTVVPFLKKTKAPLFDKTLKLTIAKDLVNGIGLNKFTVQVDRYNKIPELNENNNSTTGQIPMFIPGGDIIPVYPYEYAIVPDLSNITLKASTANPFATNTTYRIQVDTNDLFLQPLINTTITAPGGVVNVPVTLLNKDSMVYFWRIARDSSNPAAINWRESSFQTIANKKGWSQAHFFQFKKDEYQFVKYFKNLRKFDFVNDVKTIFCKTGYVGAPYNIQNFAENGYYINNSQQVYWTCGGGNGWTFAVFDSITGKPELADTTLHAPNSGTWLSQYNSCACVPELRPAFDFGTFNYCGDAADWKLRVEQFINAIPAGKRVLAYSHDNDAATTFSPSLRQAFNKIGSDQIQNKPDTCQMVIFGVKRPYAHTQANEIIGARIKDIVSLTDTLTTNWTHGYIASEIIGPSSHWESFHWRYRSLESPSTDSITVKLVGIKSNGKRDTLSSFSITQQDIINLGNYIDAGIYPQLQLVAFMSDNVNNSAPQLQRWQVIFDEMPEAALHPPAGYSISNTSIQEGDQLQVKIPVKNIGSVPFQDSLLIHYWIEDAHAVNHPLPYRLKKKGFMPDSLIIDTLKINSLGYPGNNALWVEVNSLHHPKHQEEQHHFNNIMRIPFTVGKDNINPLLDVTFDGVHILNGDIISSRPNILISLKDENKYLALNDTGDFAIYLKYPGNPQEEHIYFNGNLLFTPAQLPHNSCRINFSPQLLKDGKYELTIQAKDRSDNESGATNYKIQFEIVNKSSITEIMNYPNPFSTSTRFVFTLTGHEIPETFKIQIMTISGKVVREITRQELGNIHIGRNITEFAWDGKDTYGDALGNGVYLYKVITKLNGESIERKTSGADEYIKNGLGKMVIMR